MADIRFECSSCGQSIAAPEQLVNELIECSTCRQVIEVPSSTKPPQAPPQIPLQSPSTLPSVQGYAAQPAPRHTVFYYVFWGTVSLFVTLAILVVGFLFLTAAGAGFLSGFTSESPMLPGAKSAVTVQNLPALSLEEAQAADKIMGTLRINKDEIEGITWYSPETGDDYKTAVFLYIGKKATGKPWLRWKIRYYGDDWLFVRRYRLKIDQDDPRTLLPTGEIKRDNSAGSVWEIFDESAMDHASLLNKILASKTTRIRMEGSEGVKDVELDPQCLQEMRNVLIVYRHMGGVWSAE